MLHRDYYRERADGIKLYRTYSDEGYLIRQIDTGELYEEAIDVEDTTHTYEETTLTEEIDNKDNDIV